LCKFNLNKDALKRASPSPPQMLLKAIPFSHRLMFSLDIVQSACLHLNRVGSLFMRRHSPPLFLDFQDYELKNDLSKPFSDSLAVCTTQPVYSLFPRFHPVEPITDPFTPILTQERRRPPRFTRPNFPCPHPKSFSLIYYTPL